MNLRGHIVTTEATECYLLVVSDKPDIPVARVCVISSEALSKNAVRIEGTDWYLYPNLDYPVLREECTSVFPEPLDKSIMTEVQHIRRAYFLEELEEYPENEALFKKCRLIPAKADAAILD